MPEAWPAYSAPVSVPVRHIWAHGHREGSTDWPVAIPSAGGVGFATVKLPTGWDGFSKLVYWYVSGGTDAALAVDFQIDGGTCNEAPNTHTQTTAANTEDVTADLYECTSVLVKLSTVIAAVGACDVLKCWLKNNDDDHTIYFYGVEIEES